MSSGQERKAAQSILLEKIPERTQHPRGTQWPMVAPLQWTLYLSFQKPQCKPERRWKVSREAPTQRVEAGISEALSVCAPAVELWDPILLASVISFPSTAMTQPASVLPQGPPTRSGSPHCQPSHTRMATLLPATLSAKVEREGLENDVK